eukprot:scaffold145606_cov35-Tisochrysis_lutea.AAC.1
MGEERPTLLACLMACQEQITLLTHSLPGRLACLAHPGMSWPGRAPKKVTEGAQHTTDRTTAREGTVLEGGGESHISYNVRGERTAYGTHCTSRPGARR